MLEKILILLDFCKGRYILRKDIYWRKILRKVMTETKKIEEWNLQINIELLKFYVHTWRTELNTFGTSSALMKCLLILLTVPFNRITRISTKNFLTFSFNPFVTLMQNVKAIPCVRSKLLNLKQDYFSKKVVFLVKSL